MNKKDIHFGDLIKRVLHEQERSIAWLAREIKCDRGNLHRMLCQKDVSVKLLRRISYALNYNFGEPFSQQIAENLRCKNNDKMVVY